MVSKRTRKQKGGNNPSGWGYVYNTVGDGWTQFQNALTLQPGQNMGTIQSNDIEPRNNINAQNTEGFPTQKDLSLIQKAGKKKNGKKGGNWGNVLGQAIVPFGLLGAQQMYGKKRSKKGGNIAGLIGQAAAPLTILAAQQYYGNKKIYKPNTKRRIHRIKSRKNKKNI